MTVTLITTNHTDTSIYTDSTFCTASSWILIVESGYSDSDYDLSTVPW